MFGRPIRQNGLFAAVDGIDSSRDYSKFDREFDNLFDRFREFPTRSVDFDARYLASLPAIYR